MNKDCPLRPMYNCYKEKCAWYLVQSKQCAIPLIASRLERPPTKKTTKEYWADRRG